MPTKEIVQRAFQFIREGLTFNVACSDEIPDVLDRRTMMMINCIRAYKRHGDWCSFETRYAPAEVRHFLQTEDYDF